MLDSKMNSGLLLPTTNDQRPTTNDRALSHQLQAANKKALRRFPGHRARFSYDDLFSYLVMQPEHASFAKLFQGIQVSR
jgi:hypothetical protein